ncbi:MAG: nickel pincer cofactor biosynthesis protein LarB [Gemmataceae bacterium]
MDAERLREFLQTLGGDPSRPGDLGYAHVDLSRRDRCGFPEVIFAQGKSPEQVVGVVRRLREAGQHCLATRVDDTVAEALAQTFPDGQQDRIARTFFLPVGPLPSPVGEVLILTAGTTDLPVAREVLVTVQAMGCGAELIADVGVAGLHRLLSRLPRLHQADVVCVVAGMDGALPSVVGGLVRVPVIAVPTSVGYGASFGGVAALLTMLNACSAGVVTVNIDAGFKAGYTAALIARRTAGKGS